MSQGERTLAIRVEGKVQGVFFRAYTREQATRLGIKGWVINREDGSVEGALHGPGAALAELVGLLRKGPPDAEVKSLDVRSVDHGRITEPQADAYTF